MAATEQRPSWHVETRDGVPCIVADGDVLPPGFARLQQPNYWAREKLDQFGETGFSLFFVQIGELDTLGWCWDGRDGLDFTQYELHLRGILEKRPDARFILFLGGRPPYRWQQDHPDELATDDQGRPTNLAAPSSERWIEDSTRAVERFVAHVEASDLAPHVVGYNPIYATNEWLLAGLSADRSPGTLRRFRAWLRERHGDETTLAKAWKQPEVTFATAAIPTSAEIDGNGLRGTFDRARVHGEHASDYLRFFNASVANLLLAHAAAIKRASGRRKLVSVMFGYTYAYLSGCRSPAHSGHLDLLPVIAHPDVDLVHCPYDYYNRCAGGVHLSQVAADAVLARGKVFATQIDTKTHVHDLDRGNAVTPWESEQVLTRDVAYALTRGAHYYYYEMCVPCWRGQTGPVEWRPLAFSPPNVQRVITRLREVADRNHRDGPRDATEIALVTSRHSHYVRALDKRYHDLFVQGQRNYLMAYGSAPFHDLVLEDLPAVRRDYKLYIFPDAHLVPTGLRRHLRERLESSGATAVWFHAAGIADEKGIGLDRAEALTGIRLRELPAIRDFLQVRLERFDHPLHAGLESEGTFGSDIDPDFFQSRQEWLAWPLMDREDYKFSPHFVADDPGATSLGTMIAARGSGIASKQVGGMRSLFVGAPLPTPRWWMNLYRWCGVHVYSDRPDLVYADRHHVVLAANGAGPRTLLLPRPSKVTLPLEDDRVLGHGERFPIELVENEVRLFGLG